MIVHYFDPSAWVKRYFEELGSGTVNGLFRTTASAACSRLGVVEVIATIARKSRGEAFDPSAVESLLENVRSDFAKFRVVPMSEPLIIEATKVAFKYRLRTMDAIHLACALHLGPLAETVMVSVDLELLEAAGQEGLSTINPSLLGKAPTVR